MKPAEEASPVEDTSSTEDNTGDNHKKGKYDLLPPSPLESDSADLYLGNQCHAPPTRKGKKPTKVSSVKDPSSAEETQDDLMDPPTGQGMYRLHSPFPLKLMILICLQVSNAASPQSGN